MVSTSAFAISDEKLVNKCAEKASSKILSRMNGLNQCSFIKESLAGNDIDNRFYNPSKYVWYTGKIECAGTESVIQVLVQYDSRSRKCY